MTAILAITMLTTGFICYHFLAQSLSLRANFEKKWGDGKTKVYWIYFQRLAGVFFFGIFPVSVMLFQGLDFQEFGINFQNGTTTLGWALGLSSVVILMNFFAARTPDNLAMYPQIRVRQWNPALKAGSALTWAAYLLAYEFLFRGFLLFSCEKEMGDWLAIAANVSLYALVHVPKGLKETVGAIPLGTILCLLTLKTGNIWIAFLVHVAMALSNEWFSIYYMRRRE